MAFTPTLFIGIGEFNHYYTLRETYQHFFTVGGKEYVEVRSCHICNLSQNAAEAIAKLQEHGVRLGVKCQPTTEADLHGMLDEIKRANEAELEARRQRQAQWEADRANLAADREAEFLANLEAGIYPFGRYAGEAFENLPNDFCRWLKSTLPEFETGSHMALVAAAVAAKCPDKCAPLFNQHRTIGSIGERITMEVEVHRCIAFDGFYGRTYLVIMREASGCCVVSRGQFYAKEGKKMSIKCTVKEHEEYRGQMQTKVQRIKEL
ncbi:MAG: hypothetical protein AAFO75_10180 [Pseudomonadota bacterium]